MARNTDPARTKDARRLEATLASQFTEKEADLAAKIENDIAEDIDCNDSKKDLRTAVHYWACVASDNWAELLCLRSSAGVALMKAANDLLGAAVNLDKPVSSGKKDQR